MPSGLSLVDDAVAVRGGLDRRSRPGVGAAADASLRRRVRADGGEVAFSVWVSGPWRGELEDAIGPVMAWVIPIVLAYIPGLVIGFMAFTLLITAFGSYRSSRRRERGRGEWPP